jgi:DNA polymerase I-like protein with 3'-5' exonuclease and polymerase domains
MTTLALPPVHGRSFDSTLDSARLRSNHQRVLMLLADGMWHSATEITSVGGSQGLRRARSLREYGLTLDRRRVGGGLWEYRLDISGLSQHDLERVMQKQKTRPIAIDTETWLISPHGKLAPRLVCVSWSDGQTTGILPVNRDTCEKLRQWLRTETIIGHNIAFDLGVVLAQWDLWDEVFTAYDDGRILDTGISAQLDHIAAGTYKLRSHSLAACVEEYCGEILGGKEDADAWRFRYRELDGVPFGQWPQEAIDYAQSDARATWDLWEALPHSPTLADQCRAAFALHLCSCWGIRTDQEAVDVVEDRLRSQISSKMPLLREAGIYRPDGKKDLSVVRERISRSLGSPPTTPKGAVSTTTETLRKTDDLLLHSLADISNAQKLLTTYVPVLRQAQDRAFSPRFRVLVESGRTSCRNPNLQNLPRKGGIRECLRPRDGYVYISADYSTIELACLAQVLVKRYGYSPMAQALKAGRDLHIETASKILGLPYETVMEQYKAGDAAAKNARTLAKAANFGYPGGCSPQKFRSIAKGFGLDLSHQQAQRLKLQWLATYPEMEMYFDDISVLVSGGFATVTHPLTGFIRGGLGYCDSANHYFQHLCAHGSKAALYAVQRECWLDPSSPLYTSRPIAFVHDEIVCESPRHKASEAAVRLGQVMEQEMARFVTDVPVSAEPCVMEIWSKDAKAAHDPNGQLIPWTPA